MHQGQKPGKTAPGGYVSSLTRGKNPSKVPLVIIFKEQAFRQKLHIEHLMKSPLAQSDAPGAKTPQNCPWWVRFRADQGQKPRKTAPGGQVSGLTRGKMPGNPPSGLGGSLGDAQRTEQRSEDLHAGDNAPNSAKTLLPDPQLGKNPYLYLHVFSYGHV